MEKKIYIRNMVCDRCIMAVKEIFVKEGVIPDCVKLGEVIIQGTCNRQDMENIRAELEKIGFDIVKDRREKLVVNVKSLIVEMVFEHDAALRENLSEYISSRIGYDYNYISTVFSEEEKISIERYFILQKIERVKELLLYGELSLSEIAHKLNYSSVAHLSSQFKKIMGLSPSHFRKKGNDARIPLDRL